MANLSSETKERRSPLRVCFDHEGFALKAEHTEFSQRFQPASSSCAQLQVHPVQVDTALISASTLPFILLTLSSPVTALQGLTHSEFLAAFSLHFSEPLLSNSLHHSPLSRVKKAWPLTHQPPNRPETCYMMQPILNHPGARIPLGFSTSCQVILIYNRFLKALDWMLWATWLGLKGPYTL